MKIFGPKGSILGGIQQLQASGQRTAALARYAQALKNLVRELGGVF